MEQHGTENLREKLELHKRWLHERLQSEHQDHDQDNIETQQTGSFRGHHREVSEPPLRNANLFIDECAEEQEDDEYQNRNYENYKETPESSINQKSFSGYGNQRRASVENSHDRSLENGKKPKRWEALYNLNKKSLQMKEQISRELENKELDSECTFQPKIKSSYQNTAMLNPLSIHERNRLWKERKEAKLAVTRESGKDKDLEQCTFKPHVSPRKRNENFGGVTTFQSKGIETHLKRQFMARKTKEEKEMILENPLSRLPENVLKKEGKVTIPKGPKFVGNKKGFDISSLKKPLNPFQPTKQSKPTNYGPIYSKRNSMTPLGERNSNIYREEFYYDEAEDNMQGNHGFSQVLQSLHNELHNFELKYE